MATTTPTNDAGIQSNINEIADALGGNTPAAQFIVANGDMWNRLRRIGAAQDRKRLDARILAAQKAQKAVGAALRAAATAQRAVDDLACAMHNEPMPAPRLRQTQIWGDVATKIDDAIAADTAALAALHTEQGTGEGKGIN